jgi:hypothetical protein
MGTPVQSGNSLGNKSLGFQTIFELKVLMLRSRVANRRAYLWHMFKIICNALFFGDVLLHNKLLILFHMYGRFALQEIV